MTIAIMRDVTRETHTYFRTLEIENAAPILLERRYSHGGKELLPDMARAKWSHGKPIRAIEVSGHVLKKDRTTGQNRASIDYITPADERYGKGYDWAGLDAPEWLLELFGINPA